MTQNNGNKRLSTTIHNETECSSDNKNIVSDFRRALPQFCVVGVKNLILLGWGLILGYPTILIPALQNKSEHNSTLQMDFVLDDVQISWIGSITMLCTPIGSMISGLLMEPLGKRRMMQLLNLPMLAAWALFYSATDISHIYIALGLSGMSGGLLEAPLLIYIAETVQPQYRGMLTASGTATALAGVFLQFIIGSILHWRTVAAMSAIVPCLAILAVFLVPESPYWLYARNRVDDAHKSLQWLRGWVSARSVEDEFKDVINSVESLNADKKPRRVVQSAAKMSESKRNSHHFKPFTKRTFVAPFLLVFSGFIFSHFSGLTPLQTYAIQILRSYHVPLNEYSATVFLGAAQVIGCLIGMMLVRSTGKRSLVFASFIGCGLCFVTVATQSHLSYGSHPFHMYSESSLNMSVESLEANVLNVIDSLRNRYRMERESGNQGAHETVQNADNFTLNTNTYRHISPDILTEFQLLVHEMNGQSFTAQNSKKLNVFNEKTTLTFNSTIINRSHVRQMVNATNRDEISGDKLFELLNITKTIIDTFLPNVLPNDDDSNLTNSRLNEIERDMWNILISNITTQESHLAEQVTELSIALSNVGKKIRHESLAQTETNYRWMPLILLLGGTTFAHCGAKLFPWMLIGEVYPMEVRSTAAAMSSALGYLVGFLSNKLFLTMVAALTLNGTFWFYSAVSAVGVVVLYFTLPETENRTLQEIQEFFVKTKPIIQHQSNGKQSNNTNNA